MKKLPFKQGSPIFRESEMCAELVLSLSECDLKSSGLQHCMNKYQSLMYP